MINRKEYGLHHPENIVPCCKNCQKRVTFKGNKISWESHLKQICQSKSEDDRFEFRRRKILDHVEKGKYAHPRLSDEERNSIRIISERLYDSVAKESDKFLIMYSELEKAFVHK